MKKLMDGRVVAIDLTDALKKKVANLISNGIIPTLAIVRVGDRPDDISYEKGILKSAAKIGIEVENVVLPKNISLEAFSAVIDFLNTSENVHGVLVFRPLPTQLPVEKVKNLLDPEKDIDCMTSTNLGKIFEGDDSGFSPNTPAAVMEMLDFYGIELTGKKVAVIGRSLVVGKPQALILVDRNATVIICHSKTENLAEVTSECDIVISAVGKPKFVKGEFIKNDAIVIDVGINFDENGKLCGDVDFDQVENKASLITPVPGGVGAVTNIVLLKQLVKATIKHSENLNFDNYKKN